MILSNFAARAIEIQYTVAFPEPHTHYADVVMELNGCNSKILEVKLPVWIPGSYMVRDFSRFIDFFEVADGNDKQVKFEKVDKNTWRIYADGSTRLKVHYKVYAFELTVRSSFIDDEHAYLNGSSLFLFAEEYVKLPVKVHILPAPSWKVISVALERVNEEDPWTLKAPNYDDLIDAPFEIGNHVVFKFTTSGVPHEVAMFGEGNYDVEKLKKDMARIVDECTAVFGSHPCKRYVFIIHNLMSGGGGLEHKNSTTLQANKWGYAAESSYTGFLSLVAHEYFHLWNVKRLKPVPLGPFDYNKENYTTLLWFAEGFTAYYDDMIVYRCGLSTESDYLRSIAGSMSYCTNQKGAALQSLAESSLDAWIKYYRSYENSNNASVSYYTKGSVVAALLDMEIIKATKGGKSLDDVMREMYQQFYLKKEKAITQADIMSVVKSVSGKDMDAFFYEAIQGVKGLPMVTAVEGLGLTLSDLNREAVTPFTGINTSFSAGKLVVTSILRDSPAWKAGINVNDELIAMNEYRLGDDLNKFISMKAVGDNIDFTVNRNGYMKHISLTLENAAFVKYALDKSSTTTEEKKRNYAKWMHVRF